MTKFKPPPPLHDRYRIEYLHSKSLIPGIDWSSACMGLEPLAWLINLTYNKSSKCKEKKIYDTFLFCFDFEWGHSNEKNIECFMFNTNYLNILKQ